jgi:hypothetical protein
MKSCSIACGILLAIHVRDHGDGEIWKLWIKWQKTDWSDALHHHLKISETGTLVNTTNITRNQLINQSMNR